MHPVIIPVAAALLLAQAQTPSPARIGNVWDNQAHQPTRTEERTLEDAAGLRGSEAEQQTEDDELNALDREIVERAEETDGDGGADLMDPYPASP